tara:strand:- start:217 stop:1116 length:900 start_codon:yes stop_codon:yes gene_type:complete
MAFWWVSQNKTFKQERSGNYLWAPSQSSDGGYPFHWSNMKKLSVGDIVFSYVDQHIPAVSIIKKNAESSNRPLEFPDISEVQNWRFKGLKSVSDYTDLNTPLNVLHIKDKLLEILPNKYSPLDKNGSGNQGYLFSINSKSGNFLLDQIAELNKLDFESNFENNISSSLEDETESVRLIQARKGQGKFRRDLFNVWGSKCCVTGLTTATLLKASHIKPWKDSNNQERLNPNNGLLLAPNFDAAFDRGLISFNQNGDIVVSNNSLVQLNKIGIHGSEEIRFLNSQQKEFMKYHYQQVFWGV